MQKGAEVMHKTDYSFLNNGMLPAGLLNITADIYSLRALSWSRKNQFADVSSALAAIAKVQPDTGMLLQKSIRSMGTCTSDKRILYAFTQS